MIDIKQYEFYYNLRTLPYVEEISLFGSRAKGDAGERSDIDLAISCPNANTTEWQEILKIIDTADTLLKIDCIRLDQLQDERLKKEIASTKTLLFKRVKNNYNWYDTFLDLGEALDKFKKIISYNKNDFLYIVEATIQIFEYTFELYWKLLKKICREEGTETNSPRSTLQQAYTIKLIDNEQIWLEIMENRNLTSHTYKPSTANEIYEHCKIYQPIMEATYQHLKERFHL